MSDKQADALNAIDSKIDKFMVAQKASAERLVKIEICLEEDKEERETQAEKIASIAEKQEADEKWLREVEMKANTKRFGNGAGFESDELRALLPDNFKAQIPALAEANRVRVKNKQSHFGAENDEIQQMGIAAWFMARVKQAICLKNGRPDLAGKWRELQDKVHDALGGAIGPNGQKVALQEDTSGEGGLLVPTLVDAQIGSILRDNGVCRAAGPRIIQMTTKDIVMPTKANNFTVSIVNEEATIPDATPATPFSSGTLTAKKFAGLVTLADELIQDSVVNLMDWIMTDLLIEMARLEDAQALEGDGTGSNFTGLIGASGVVAVASGTPAAIAAGDWQKLIYGAEESSLIDGGIVWCHPWIVRDLLTLDTGSAGQLIWPFLSQNEATPTNIGGAKVFRTNVISKTSGAGLETFVYHGNPQAMVFGDRNNTTFDVDPFGLFDKSQIRLRLLKRTAILIWVPAAFTRLEDVKVAA